MCDDDTTAISCQKLVGLLTEYTEGELDAPRRSALERHLGQCPSCEAFFSEYQLASCACRAHLLDRVPVDLEQKLISFLRAEKERSSS